MSAIDLQYPQWRELDRLASELEQLRIALLTRACVRMKFGVLEIEFALIFSSAITDSRNGHRGYKLKSAVEREKCWFIIGVHSNWHAI